MEGHLSSQVLNKFSNGECFFRDGGDSARFVLAQCREIGLEITSSIFFHELCNTSGVSMLT